MNRLAFALLVVWATAVGAGCCALVNVTPSEHASAVRTVTLSATRVVMTCDDKPVIVGSGVAIAADEVLTAKHVVEHDCDDREDGTHAVKAFILERRDGAMFFAQVKRTATDADAAILETTTSRHAFDVYARVAKAEPDVDDPVTICAGDGLMDLHYPGDNFLLKHGTVSHATRWKQYRLLVLSIHVVAGNSGGGVFNERGEIVGIVTAGLWVSMYENFGLVTSVRDLKGFLP